MQLYELVGEGILKTAVPVTIDEVAVKTNQLQTLQSLGTSIVDQYLDTIAKQHGYADIISARSYTGFTNQFQDESQRFVAFSAECWSTAFSIFDGVINHGNNSPTIEEFKAQLPTFQ